MTSRRRRSRTTVASVLVALGVALAVALLHVAGVIPSAGGPDADAAPTAGAGTTISTSPAGGTTTATDVPGASGASRPAPADAAAGASARAQLAALPVKGKAPATGYDRVGDFGPAWLDVDHNGCDTRNDVLARDLSAITRQGPCKVVTGTLVSPYTGARIAFVRGNSTSTLVQIDHVVALENAWVTGAQQLTVTQREALANDPENLFAVDGRSNSQKGSGDAATWLPANTAFRCTYVEHQVAVKAKYHLWVAPAERDAMERVLSRC
ncbi:HNH endonuclease family protein [Curtobacterium sp. ISL-83]|uniref:HNH endonuclease family protein n=1 Tax=Curtobacterium sp. ISL-83 TaxID=2819145 RepID=UPI001BE96EEA|nr:HNH endonuclease family protein [Curtobacterium sp. ISL-83]MBT2500954.1 HNH endonuclease [Curtobacterium sp. ISL-83]